MADSLELATARFAALVAPAIERAFVSCTKAQRDAGGRDLVAKYTDAAPGVGPGPTPGVGPGPVIDLRGPLLAGQTITYDAVKRSTYRYQDEAIAQAALLDAVENGLIKYTSADSFTATARGRAFLSELYAHHAQVLGDRWGSEAHAARVELLRSLIDRVLKSADATGGAGWAMFYPPYEPGSHAGRALFNGLSVLRAHRADVHAAAWQAAGLTAAEIVAMPPGPARDAIEDETNERAGVPYATLSPAERFTLLADLAALP